MATLMAVVLTVPARGQRGGHGSMGMGGGRGGVVNAPHGGGYAAAPRGNWGGYHAGFGHGPYPGHLPYYPGRYPYYGWRYPWWGYRGGYGYGWWGYPGWGWYGGISVGWTGDDYSYPATSYPAYAYSSPDTTSAYINYDQQQQIDRLNVEVTRLRAEQQAGGAGASVPKPPAQAEIRATTVLVFRDHHSEEIENYAIVGKTLWVFTEQRARKIPLAELNVAATTKANEARGIDFRLPQ